MLCGCHVFEKSTKMVSNANDQYKFPLVLEHKRGYPLAPAAPPILAKYHTTRTIINP